MRSDKYYALAADAVRSLGRFVLAMLLLRYGIDHEYALYVVLCVVEVIAGSLLQSLWATPALIVLPRANSRTQQALAPLLRRSHSRSLLVLTFPVALIGLISSHAYGHSVITGLLFVFAVALWALFDFRRSEARATFDNKRVLIAEGIACGMSLSALGLALATSLPHLEALFLGRGLGSWAAILWLRQPQEPVDPDRHAHHLYQEAKSTGQILIGGSLANSICSRTQPWALAILCPPSQVVLWGASSTLVGPLRLLAVSLSSLLRARLSRCLQFRQEARSRQLMLGLCSGTLAVGLGLLTLTPPLEGALIGWLGLASDDFGPCLRMALLYATLDVMTSFLAVGLQALGHSRITTWLRILSAILSVLLMLPSAYLFGAYGAYSSLVLVELLYGIVAVYAWKRASHSLSPLPLPFIENRLPRLEALR